MSIIVNTQRLLHILDVTPASHNVMLVGRHGIGKSEILTHYYNTRGMRVVPLFLGQMSDPGDLIGLPKVATTTVATATTASQEAQTSGIDSRTEFVPPFWWPADGQPIVLFLDELNRARPELLQTVMDLVLSHTLAGRHLPEGSRIIAAINDGDEYQLSHMDPALVSRFNVYEFRPTVQEWLQWAESNGIDQRVVKFIALEGHWLDGIEGQRSGEDTGLDKIPDRRAWQRVSECIKPYTELADEDIDLIAGIVGPQAASRFMGSLTGHAVLTGAEVLQHFEQHEATLRKYLLHQLAMVNESIFRHLEVAGDDSPAEYATNLDAYVNLLTEMEAREATAHFANLFESQSFPKAILFIAERTPGVAQSLMNFIASL
ncbi:MAG: AAA family ATPase [Bacteroidales bacterium]|nr:AAA family ATPase [Candidatus Liminaster caballi]